MAENWLVISGVGQDNAKSATHYLNKVSGAKKWAVWVNVGIAGSSTGTYGDLFLIDKITQERSNQCFYPGTIMKSNLRRGTLITLDKPIFDYSNDDLIDMEAAEFTRVASNISCRDLVLVLKVVSDGPRDPALGLKAVKVTELISRNLRFVINHVEKLVSLASLEKDRFNDPLGYKVALEKWHFTVSQAHELKKLISRWVVAMPSINVIDKIAELRNSREVIEYLRNYLNNYEIDWN